MRLRERRHHCDTHSLSVVSVVRVLAIVVIGGMATMAYVSLTGGQVPSEIDKLTHAALGALVAMLSQTRSAPAETQIVNPPSEPVPVEPVVEEKE